MAYVASYSHFTAGSVPLASWEEAYHTAASWKSYLQSFPGMLNVHIAARHLDNGDVRLQLVTIWEHIEQLEAWADSPYSGEKLLLGLDVPAYEVVAETFEDLS